MKKNTFILLALGASLSFITSCKKDDSPAPSVSLANTVYTYSSSQSTTKYSFDTETLVSFTEESNVEEEVGIADLLGGGTGGQEFGDLTNLFGGETGGFDLPEEGTDDQGDLTDLLGGGTGGQGFGDLTDLLGGETGEDLPEEGLDNIDLSEVDLEDIDFPEGGLNGIDFPEQEGGTQVFRKTEPRASSGGTYEYFPPQITITIDGKEYSGTISDDRKTLIIDGVSYEKD